MIEHRSPISGVACFRDKYVATAGYDGQVILWDAQTRTAIARARHDHLANQCSFSACGTMLVTSSSDYSSRVWTVPDLRLMAIMQHDDDVERSVFSPSGRAVATASRDGGARIFGLDGRLLHHLKGHAADCVTIEWTPSGEQVVSHSDDGDVRRWDAGTGELLEQVTFGSVQMDAIALGPPGTIYAGNDDGDIVALGGGASVTTHGHAAGVKCLVYDAASSTLISMGYDRFIRTWRVASDGGLRPDLRVEAPSCVWLRSCAIDGDGRLIVGTFGSSYAIYDDRTKTWDFSRVRDTPGLNAVRYHRNSVWSVGDAGSVLCDGVPVSKVGSLCNFLLATNRRILTGGQSGEIFDAETGAVIYRHNAPLNCGVAIRFGDRDRAVVGSYSGEVLVFEDRGDVLDLVVNVRLFPSAVKGVAYNGSVVFGACANASVAWFDAESFQILHRVEWAHAKIANGAAPLSDGRFVSVGRDLMMTIWGASEPQKIRTPHQHSVRCVAACAQTDLIATGAYDGTISIFSVAHGKWLRTERPTDFGISSLCTGARPGVFLASSYDGSVYEIDVDAGARRTSRISVAA
jgi:WD40 repeat protein